MKFTATNSKILNDQIDKFNASHPSADLIVSWGREGKRGTWFAHGAYGRDLRIGLTFDEVVAYVQGKATAYLELEADERAETSNGH